MTGKIVKRITDTGQMVKLALSGVSVVLLALSAAPAAHGAFFDLAGKSARIMGMNEVFLASSRDAAGYWYNPAGLSHMPKRQLGVTYGVPMSAVSELNISQVNIATPLGERSGLGFGVSSSGITEASEMVISGGYGLSLTKRLSFGVNAKLMRWSAEGSPLVSGGSGNDNDFSKTSFSFDLSAMYGMGNLFGLGDVTTGIYFRNPISPNISKSGSGDDGKLPLEAGFGVMVRRGPVVAETDVAYRDGNTIVRTGAEYGLGEELALRGGLAYDSDFASSPRKLDFDLGFGYNFGFMQFDYALIVPLEVVDSGGKHFVSFGASF